MTISYNLHMVLMKEAWYRKYYHSEQERNHRKTVRQQEQQAKSDERKRKRERVRRIMGNFTDVRDVDIAILKDYEKLKDKEFIVMFPRKRGITYMVEQLKATIKK